MSQQAAENPIIGVKVLGMCNVSGQPRPVVMLTLHPEYLEYLNAKVINDAK
jgi:hypothetical protein